MPVAKYCAFPESSDSISSHASLSSPLFDLTRHVHTGADKRQGGSIFLHIVFMLEHILELDAAPASSSCPLVTFNIEVGKLIR